jgi:hypothetical protein
MLSHQSLFLLGMLATVVVLQATSYVAVPMASEALADAARRAKV